MKLINLRSCLFVLAVAAAAVSQADDSFNLRGVAAPEADHIIKAGDVTFGISGTTGTSMGNSFTVASISASYFFTSSISLGVGFGYTSLTSGDEDYTAFAEGRYYVAGSGQMAPFVGVMYNYGNGPDTGEFTGWSGEIGLDWFFNHHVSFTPRVVWTQNSSSGTTIDSTALDFGLTFWFK